jgi:hypothetical protein
LGRMRHASASKLPASSSYRLISGTFTALALSGCAAIERRERQALAACDAPISAPLVRSPSAAAAPARARAASSFPP